jgi:hypothetical protein
MADDFVISEGNKHTNDISAGRMFITGVEGRGM